MLSVEITSFSFKKGIPQVNQQHGGGYVFDCRSLPNPGREEAFKPLSGQAPQVRAFLGRSPEAVSFGTHVLALIDQSAANYLERGFDKLAVSFGCTGGQHRSVFFAELLAQHLRSNPAIRIELSHRDLETALREASTK